MITGKYPNLRLRRSRKYAWSRKLVQENSLSYSDLILPIFLIEGKNKKESIKSMPNVFRYSVDKLNIVVGKAIKKGIPMVALENLTHGLDGKFLSCMDIKLGTSTITMDCKKKS